MKTTVLSRISGIAAVVLSAAFLVACSTVSPLGNIPAVPTSVDTEVFGDGALVLGVVSFSEPVNRSGGVADASHKAAKLAVESLELSRVKLVSFPETGGAGASLGKRFVEAGARLVVGGTDPSVMAGLARAMPSGAISTITLAPIADMQVHLYSAALAPRDEARALVNEAKRLDYHRIVLVTGAEPDSTTLAAVIAASAAEQGIAVQQIHATDSAGFADNLASLRTSSKVDAFVFLIDPQRTFNLVRDVELVGTRIVGNAGWALAEPLPGILRNSWYPSLPREAISKFVSRFRNAYGETPTLAAAVIYDLVVLAAALDQIKGADAFSSVTLKSDFGFSGFTGPFTFGAVGLIEARQYEIVTGR